jgi:hypothetical protein
MFEKWFNAFAESGSGTLVNIATTSGGGTPPRKDLNFLLNACITADNKLRTISSIGLADPDDPGGPLDP